MEDIYFFTKEEKEQLITLYKKLLRISGDTLQKEDCHKIKNHLRKAAENNILKRNAFGMNPIIKEMQTAVIVSEEIGMKRASIIAAMLNDSVIDGFYSIEEVENEYGKDVATIIKGLVKINELYAKSPTIESENFRNLIISFAEDMQIGRASCRERV